MAPSFSPFEGEPVDIQKERDRQSALTQASENMRKRFGPTSTPPAWMRLPQGWEVIGKWGQTYVVWNWFAPGKFDIEYISEDDVENLDEILAYDGLEEPPEMTRLESERTTRRFMIGTLGFVIGLSTLSAVLRGCPSQESKNQKPAPRASKQETLEK